MVTARNTRPASPITATEITWPGNPPTFFRALCWSTASRSHGATYRHVGSQMYNAIFAELDSSLVRAIEHAFCDDASLISVLQREFPKFMRLVPRRRRALFLEGFRASWNGMEVR